MIKNITLRIMTIVIFSFNMFSMQTNTESIYSYENHPSIREISTYLERLEVNESWQLWIESYLAYFTIEIDENENPQDQIEENEPSDPAIQEEEPKENIQPVAPKPEKGEQKKHEPKNTAENKAEQKPEKKPEQEKPQAEPKPTETKEPEKQPEKEVSQSIDHRAYERKVAELTNQERVAHGLDPLILDSALSEVARIKSNDMNDNNYFSHTSPTYGSPFEMMGNFGISYFSAAENIAHGHLTPEDVVTGWMHSSGHRANILDENLTHIGVGLSDNYHWTQMFIGK